MADEHIGDNSAPDAAESLGIEKGNKESQEDLQSLTKDEILARYLRVKKKTNEWKEQMKAITVKDRTQLNLVTTQLKSNTKVLNETTQRLEDKERECTRLEKEKRDLETKLQSKEKQLLEYRDMVNRRPSDSAAAPLKAKSEEAITEEVSKRIESEFSAKLRDLEHSHAQQMEDLRRSQSDQASKMESELSALRKQLGESQAQIEMLSQPKDESSLLETAEAKQRELETKIMTLEADRDRIANEFEQYKLRSQTAFRNAKQTERQVQQQLLTIRQLEEQIETLKTMTGSSSSMQDAAVLSPGSPDSLKKAEAVSDEAEEIKRLTRQNVQLLASVEELTQTLHRLQTQPHNPHGSADLVQSILDNHATAQPFRRESKTLVESEESRKLRQKLQEMEVTYKTELEEASKREEKIKQQLARMDAQFAKEVTHLHEQLSTKTTQILLLCKRLGIRETELPDVMLMRSNSARGSMDGLTAPPAPVSPIFTNPTLSTPTSSSHSHSTSSTPTKSAAAQHHHRPLFPVSSSSSASASGTIPHSGGGGNAPARGYDLDFNSLVNTSATAADISNRELEAYLSLQVRRLNAALDASRAEIKVKNDEIAELKAAEERHLALQAALKEEIRNGQRTETRAKTFEEQLDYVKNVLMKFMLSKDPLVQKQLLPVIGTVLQLSPNENEQLSTAYNLQLKDRPKR